MREELSVEDVCEFSALSVSRVSPLIFPIAAEREYIAQFV